MLITNSLFQYLVSERGVFGSLCAGDHKKELIRQNHRERVVDHTDDRVEFSRNTLFSLPVLVPNDNSDHDHVPLSIRLVCPLTLWMHLL